jgi:hypothetical protein
MLARRQQRVGIADLHPPAIGHPHQLIGFGMPVARHRDHFEADHDVPPDPVAIAGGEVAPDAAFDLVARGDDVDRLDHVERPVGPDLHIADKAGDAFLRPGGDSDEQCQRGGDQPWQSSHGDQLFRSK